MLTALPVRHESDCGQDSTTSHSGVAVSGISERSMWKPPTQLRAQAQNSLVLEAINTGIKDLIIPHNGFDLVVGHASKGVDDVCAQTRVHILGHVAGNPRAVLAPVGEVTHNFGCCAWNGKKVRNGPCPDKCPLPPGYPGTPHIHVGHLPSCSRRARPKEERPW